MHDITRLGMTGAGFNPPPGRSGSNQHLPSTTASLAQRLEELTYAARTIGILIAILRIALRLHHLDRAPIGVELVGEDHRKARPDAGAHLGAMRDQDDPPGRRARYAT